MVKVPPDRRQCEGYNLSTAKSYSSISSGTSFPVPLLARDRWQGGKHGFTYLAKGTHDNYITVDDKLTLISDLISTSNAPPG